MNAQVTYDQVDNFDYSMTDSFVLTEKDVVMDFGEHFKSNVDLEELDNVTEMLTRLTSKDQSKIPFLMNYTSELMESFTTSYSCYFTDISQIAMSDVDKYLAEKEVKKKENDCQVKYL